MNITAFKDMALSFPGAMEIPHFDRRAFKVENKKIFASLHEESGTANLKLTPVDQSVFTSFGNGAVIYPVPNKWGQHGWTTFELNQIPEELMLDALDVAYRAAFQVKKNNTKSR